MKNRIPMEMKFKKSVIALIVIIILSASFIFVYSKINKNTDVKLGSLKITNKKYDYDIKEYNITGTLDMEKLTNSNEKMQNARLIGNNNSNISANDLDNILMGNKNNNTIDGKMGTDVLQLQGMEKDYIVIETGDGLRIEDIINNRDGIDNLMSIEILRFIDSDVIVENIDKELKCGDEACSQ